MKLAYISNHVEQALALLLDQYKDKPRIAGLVKAFVNRCQELEDAAWYLWIHRRIENATGDQLDQIGAIVGEPRNDRPDDVYRIYVNARIRINWSQGTPDDVIAVLRIVEPADFDYSELYPAAFEVQYAGPTSVASTVLADLVRQTKQAGTTYAVLGSSVPLFRQLRATYLDDMSETIAPYGVMYLDPLVVSLDFGGRVVGIYTDLT